MDKIEGITGKDLEYLGFDYKDQEEGFEHYEKGGGVGMTATLFHTPDYYEFYFLVHTKKEPHGFVPKNVRTKEDFFRYVQFVFKEKPITEEEIMDIGFSLVRGWVSSINSKSGKTYRKGETNHITVLFNDGNFWCVLVNGINAYVNNMKDLKSLCKMPGHDH